MKHLKLSLSALALALISFLFINASTSISEVSDFICRMDNTAIKGGERIVYKVFYNWKFVYIPAGEAEFTIKETPTSFNVRVIGKTYKGYDSFFKVRDYFYSEIDKSTMYPKNFVRIVEEGNYRKFDSLSFYQGRKFAISYNGKTRETAKKKIIKIEDCTHDLLSILYFMRNIDVSKYKPGDKIPTELLFDEKIYPVKVGYEGKLKDFEVKELGTFDVIKVIPDLITGNVFKEGNIMQIYVSDDNNKLPLLVESPLSVGSAKAILKSHSGLRYPLNQK